MANPGQVALVTGAGSGIGEHVAIALAKAGYQTVLTGRRLDRLEAVAGKIADAGGTAIPFAANVGDPTAVGTLFDAVKSRCGRLDLLFNNAGVGLSPGLLEDLTFEQWTSVVSTNLTGVFLCIQGAFRIMKAQTPKGGSASGTRPKRTLYRLRLRLLWAAGPNLRCWAPTTRHAMDPACVTSCTFSISPMPTAVRSRTC